MKDAITILLKTGPLDAESEAVLCEELSITYNKVEALKNSDEHESLLERVESQLEPEPRPDNKEVGQGYNNH
jgi:hypothetical protein